MKRGLTVIELIIAVAIVAILVVFSMSGFNSFRNRQSLVTSAELIASSLNKARTNTIASLNDEQYGVHFESDLVELYVGNTYQSGAGTNEETNLPRGVFIETISLNGGGFDILFNKITGETSNYGFVVVSLNSDNSQNITVSVSEAGLVSVE